MNVICETIDMVLWPYEIDMVLDVAIRLCPALKKMGTKMYPINAKRALPDVCFDYERQYLVAELLNGLAKEV